MKIELHASGRVAGDQMMVAIRESFSVQDWRRILVNVVGETFLLGDIGAPGRMMHKLVDLKDGGPVTLVIPKHVVFDLEATRGRLTHALTSFDRRVAALGERIERHKE